MEVQGPWGSMDFNCVRMNVLTMIRVKSWTTGWVCFLDIAMVTRGYDLEVTKSLEARLDTGRGGLQHRKDGVIRVAGSHLGKVLEVLP
jgi:hypothetical protein